MNKKFPTVTVAISAYNEESNIERFLCSVLRQKEDGFSLSNIIVYSDGSTDNTEKIVRSLKSSKITLITGKVRIGKSSRLNELYYKIHSNILVQSDADVIMKSKYVLSHLIKPLLANKKVGMCGGNPHPVKAKTLTEKAVNYTVAAYLELRHRVRGGNNIFSADGRLLAFKKSVYKKIVIPQDMIANDAYAYFTNKKLGFTYSFVPQAVVFFRSPETILDQIRQNTRFAAAKIRFRKLFSPRIVEQEYAIPLPILLVVYLKYFIKNPLLCTYIYLLNTYCKVRAFVVENKMNALWDMSITTKRLD